MTTARRTLVVLLVLSFLTVSGTAQAQRIFGVVWDVEDGPFIGDIVELDPAGGGKIRHVLSVPETPAFGGPYGITGGLSFDGSLLHYGSTIVEEGEPVTFRTSIREIDPDTGAILDEHALPGDGVILGLASLNDLVYISRLPPGQ
jgi:hypothetical protein